VPRTTDRPPEQIPDDRGAIAPGDSVVLIVEDDPHFARLMVGAAKDKGFKVLVAARGTEALALARAHHPTAIETTLRGLRERVGGARILAVLEPRSNTMKLGVHREQLAPALAAADLAWFLNSVDLGWDLPAAVAALGGRARFAANVDALVDGLARESRPGDQILVMSNGGFGGLHDKLLAALKGRQ